MEAECVYCAVRTGYLNKTQVKLRFQISVKRWWNDVQPPMLDTHLRLHVALNRRTNGRSLGTSRIQRSAPVAVPLIPPIPLIRVERRW